jgi:Acyl-CoA synthetases (AMP-forming)/AMP-acid ligases II
MVQTQMINKVETQSELGTLYKHLVRWAAIQPQAPYIIETITGREMTYEQALAAVNAVRQRLGTVRRTIALALPGSIATALVWMSALSGGHRLLPLSPDMPQEEKLRIIQRNRPDVLCVEDEQVAQSFALHDVSVLTLQDIDACIQQAAYQVPLVPLEGEVLLTTSGTTGDPKGVLLYEHQIAWVADQVRRNHQLTCTDRGLTPLPFFHVNAPVVSLFSSLLAGSAVVIAPRFSRRQFWSWIERYQITWASLVPTIVSILLNSESPVVVPSSLRFVRTGSAALPAADLQAFEARFGVPVIETYGLTEAASQIVANPLPPEAHKPGSAGRPVGVALRICRPRQGYADQALHDVATGEDGEICVSGPSVIHAYQDNAGATAFQQGWFRTGDLGHLDADGYLFITGRSREVIIRGGENIAPREVEEVLLSHRVVREAAVVGRPDPVYGEQVVAYIVVREDWQPALREELQRYAEQRLSRYKVPVDFIVVDALPRNATGKIERHILRAQQQAQYAI